MTPSPSYAANLCLGALDDHTRHGFEAEHGAAPLARQSGNAGADIGEGHHVVGVGFRCGAATIVTAHRVVGVATRCCGETSIQLARQPVEAAIDLVPQAIPEERFVGLDVLQVVLKDAVALVDNVSRVELAQRAGLVALGN